MVLKVRRIIDDNGRPHKTEIEIKGKLLRNTLAEMFAGISGMELNQSPPVITPEHLFHARLGLAERVKTEQAKETPEVALIDELNVVLQYIAEDHAATQATLDSLSEHDKLTFDLLWAIFPPGATVYTKVRAAYTS